MVEYVDLNHAQELDDWVLRHKNGHFMQSSLWGNVKTDWGWHGIICRDERGRIRGTMALLRHEISALKTCLLYAPRGPIFNANDTEVFSELMEAAKDLGKTYNAYRLRIDPRISDQNLAFKTYSEQLGFHIDVSEDFSLFQPRMCYIRDLRGHTPQSLLASYHRSCRNHIHRAQRMGATVRIGTADEVSVFYAMMEETADKNGFEVRSEEYYRRLLLFMPGNARLFFVCVDNTPVAAAITVIYGTCCWLMYACSHRKGLKYYPNELLQWSMQCDALKQGCRYYDFRGVEGRPVHENPKYGLHQFKRGFGAEFVGYIGQMDLNFRPFISKAVDLACKLL